jgi:hypothetical protein
MCVYTHTADHTHGRRCDGAAAARGGLPSLWARVARAAGEGSRSEAEAWRDEANEL